MDPHDHGIRPDELVSQLGWVRALARSLVFEPDMADELLQQVCLLALQRPPRQREGAGLRAWLASATRRLASRSARSETRRRRREQRAARPEAAPDTSDIAATRDELRRLVEVVTGLEEPYFTAIVERYFQGRAVDEIAARHDTTPAAVRQRLSRARQQLRARLEAVVEGDRERWALLLLPAAAVRPAPVLSLARGGLSMAQKAGLSLTLKLAAGLAAALVITLVATWWPRPPQRAGIDAPPIAAAVPPSDPSAALPTPEVATAEPLAPPAAPPHRALPKINAWGTRAPSAPPVASPEAFTVVVVDSQARPVPQALVETWRQLPDTTGIAPPDGRPEWELVTSAHADGAGRLSVTLEYDDEFVVASQDSVGASGLRNKALLRRGLNAEGEAVLALRAGIVILGRILDADDAPAPGFEVLAHDNGADPQTGPPRQGPLLVTGADGRFELHVDHCNQYSIMAWRGETRTGDGISPQPGETVEVTLRVPGQWSITGRVIDSAGAPLEGVHVIAHPVRPGATEENELDGMFPIVGSLADTDAAGAFAFSLPRGGEYLVTALAEGRPLPDPARVRLEGPNADATIELVVEDGVELSGQVVTATGEPLARAQVEIRAQPPTVLEASTFMIPTLSRTRTTGSRKDGHFRFKGLPPGCRVELRAWPFSPGQAPPAEGEWVEAATGDTDVLVVAGPPPAPRAARGSLRVRVISASTGRPVAGAPCAAMLEGESGFHIPQVSSQADGSLVVPDLDPEKPYTLVVFAEGLGALDVHGLVPSAAADAPPVEIALPELASLEIEVVDGSGALVPFAPVTLRRSFPIVREFLEPDRSRKAADSRALVRFDAVDPGSYAVIAEVDGQRGEVELTIGAGEARTVRVRLSARPRRAAAR
jgi:RNA polymerase sigma-70 factor (ECF subfamily)